MSRPSRSDWMKRRLILIILRRLPKLFDESAAAHMLGLLSAPWTQVSR
jgi:hypothetical protein